MLSIYGLGTLISKSCFVIAGIALNIGWGMTSAVMGFVLFAILTLLLKLHLKGKKNGSIENASRWRSLL
jgi:hypothetical protein